MTAETSSVEQLEMMLSGYHDPPARAIVSVRHFQRGARAKRALEAVGLCWGAAVLAVFIPVAHLILVPGLIFAGVLLGISRFRSETVVTSARGTCPDCGAEQDLDVSGRWRVPQSVTCRRCQRGLVLKQRYDVRRQT